MLRFIICFGFKKTNREISTAGGEVIYVFIEKVILQTPCLDSSLLWITLTGINFLIVIASF